MEGNMNSLINRNDLLSTLDYTSTDQMVRLLQHYSDVEALAHKGYPAALDLYLELSEALRKLTRSERTSLMNAIDDEDGEQLITGARQVQKILLGTK